MIEQVPGHTYVLDNLKGSDVTLLSFYMDPLLHKGVHQAGPSTQEVLRACIARVEYLETEKSAPENELILHHLRQAIIQFELRALRVKLEKAPVERFTVFRDGHLFRLR